MKYAYLLASCLIITPVMADEDDGTGSLMKNILSGAGLIKSDRPDIKYRERAPLVLPPGASSGNLTLPRPQESVSNTNAQWPKDNEQKAVPKMKTATGAMPASQGRKLTPAEMKDSAAVFRGDQGKVDWSNSPGVKDNNALGGFGTIFKGGLMGKEEKIEFKGEGQRASLIEPPSGYRTPSANQPYGPVGKTNYKEVKIEEKDAKKNR